MAVCVYVTHDEALNVFNIAGYEEDMFCFHKGALDKLKSDDELAFVISHEFAHILCPHLSEDHAYLVLSVLAVTFVVPPTVLSGKLPILE